MSKEINHDESFELEGKWQIFGSSVTVRQDEFVRYSNKAFPGTLTYDADKKNLILKLRPGDDRLIEEGKFANPVFVPFIRGVANLQKGKQVTLNQCYVYLYDCYMGMSIGMSIGASTSFACSGLLTGDGPLIEEEKLDSISWQDLCFAKATVEYKNLEYWGASRRLKDNIWELQRKKHEFRKEGNDGKNNDTSKTEKEKLILKMELDLEEENKRISDTLAYRNYVKTTPSAFQDGILGYISAETKSVIDFDFEREGKGTGLKDIMSQVVFLENLFLFAMLPDVSTYVLSIKLKNEQGGTYQFLQPTSYLPKREGSTVSRRYPSPQDFFIPSLHLKHIGDCFEKYKDDRRAHLLFYLFTKPSYLMGNSTDIDTMYLYMFMSLECAYRLIKKIPEDDKVQLEKMVKFFYKDEGLRNFIEKCKESEHKVWKVLKNEKLAKEICKIRNDFVHVKVAILDSDDRDKVNKISIMYECLIYQMQKELFKLPDKEIIEVLKGKLEIPGSFPRYPF